MDAATVRRRVLAAHERPITSVIDAARRVWRDLGAEPVRDAARLTGPLKRRLDERGLAGSLVGLLRTAAGVLGVPIEGQPVAAPPYLAVTSRGPICRGTLADGRRLVIVIAVFAVERRPPRYRFRDPTPAESLRVRLRDSGTTARSTTR